MNHELQNPVIKAAKAVLETLSMERMDEVEKLNRVMASLKTVEPEPELLDFATCDDDTYRRLANIATTLCTTIIPEDSSFYLVDSPKKQATVIYELSVVVVFKGMLNFIFRIASLVAAVTPCPTPAAAGTVPQSSQVKRNCGKISTLIQ